MTEPAPRGALARLLRDPLLHFVVAGGLLFAAYSAVAPEAPVSADPTRIELTTDDMRRIALVWLAQGRPLPDEAQLRALAEQEATQRILAREAVALGLDRDDEIIQRRLAQKMDFLLADLAELEEPTRADLQAWYAAHGERFALPPRASFRHLFFSVDGRGEEGARAAAAAALAEAAALPIGAPELGTLADRFMFQDFYGGRTPEHVAKDFGPAFAASLFALEPGAWHGPVRSGYGWHLVRIDTLESGRVPALSEIEPEVRAAWIDGRYREIRLRALDEMLSRYTVVVPPLDPDELVTFRAPQSGGAAAAEDLLQ